MEACAVHQTQQLEQLATYAGFSASTARKAVSSLETLGIIGRNGDGSYVLLVQGVSRGMPDEAKAQLVRRALLGFRPFEMFLEGIALGEDEREAIRKTLLLLDLPGSDASKLDVLRKWGHDLGILDESANGTELTAELTVERTDELGALSSADVESEAKARLYNARRLGRDANHYLDEIDRGLLADALLLHEEDARRSIDASGQALEDFLRHVAADHGYDSEAKKASGAGQLANLLYSKSVIHNHHQKMVDAVATIRNATAHRKDKKTLTPWELSSFGAFSAFVMTLTAIRSIQLFTQKGRQTI
jgi:hypothetical protein